MIGSIGLWCGRPSSRSTLVVCKSHRECIGSKTAPCRANQIDSTVLNWANVLLAFDTRSLCRSHPATSHQNVAVCPCCPVSLLSPRVLSAATSGRRRRMHCHFHLKKVDGFYYIDYHEDILQPKVLVFHFPCFCLPCSLSPRFQTPSI